MLITSHVRSVRTVLASLLTVVCLAAGLAVSPETQAAPSGAPPGKPVTVMTRNLYLGADINRPVEAALDAQDAGLPPAAIVGALANATHATRAIVDRTNFPVRAELLAGEIARTEPTLVGLQEVAWWRHGPLQLGQVGIPNATETDYDFLQLLLDALAAQGEEYLPVAVGERADVEAPSFTGAGSPDARDIRLTMRDVILLRADSGLRVIGEPHDQIFTHNLDVTIAGVTMNFDRGFQWVDLRGGGKSLRFVNTHLEAFSSDLAFAQASEMVATATATDRTTIVVCDCNSDPLNDKVKDHDTLPHHAPYDLITGTYTDEWLRWAPAEEGWTSGLSETVDDPTDDGFDHRIDMIFGHTVDGHQLKVERGVVTGTSVTDRDPGTGLWPSDHGGVVLRLRGW
jgi:endonuclease/exonuclease/phosphatase family metal-dependent hydrolase